jgi:hypothetical protein
MPIGRMQQKLTVGLIAEYFYSTSRITFHDRKSRLLQINLLSIHSHFVSTLQDPFDMDSRSVKPDMSTQPDRTDSTARQVQATEPSTESRTETTDPAATQAMPKSQLPMLTQENSIPSSFQERLSNDDTITTTQEDPYSLQAAKREDISKKTILESHPKGKVRKIKKYYNRQNALIDTYLGSSDEEALEIEDTLLNGGKVKFAIHASFGVNFFLFIIQMYAAVSTGSLSLFGTAADAFVSIPCS